MSKQIMCSLFCPMLNSQGFCDSAMRRVEQVRECPHRQIRAAIQTKKAPPEGGADDTVSSTGSTGARCDRVVGVGAPSGFVISGGLIAPHGPAISNAAGKQFNAGRAAACFNNRNDFVRLAAMFALHGADDIHLRACRCKRAVGSAVFADAEQQHFRYVAEIKANAAAIWTAVLADLFPDNVGFIFKAPCIHNGKSIWKQCIGHPKI